MKKLLAIALASSLAASASAFTVGKDGVTVHGSLQSDILFPEEDVAIGTEKYSDKVLTNTYANLGLFSKYVDAGVRVEYLEHPLPGFEPDFKGWGVPNFFAKFKYKGLEVTGGDFYEQFGNGFILPPTRSVRSASTTASEAAASSLTASRVSASPCWAVGREFSGIGILTRRYGAPIWNGTLTSTVNGCATTR